MKIIGWLLCVVVVLYVLVWKPATSTPSTNNFNCYANSSVSVNTLCEVKYKSNLILHCPPNNTSSLTGEWWREDPVTKKLISVCHNRSCTIKGPLHDQDSGLYFCQESSERKYYVNVTILAPPSIVCDPFYCKCNQLTNTCINPMISKDFSEDVTIIAKFKGQGSVGVVWEHNGKELNCSSELDDDDIECTITSGHTSDYDYQILTLPAPHNNITIDSGIYIANISNEYGYNMTETYVQIMCPIKEPPESTINHTTSLTEGESRTVTLRALGSRQFYMWLCYTTDPSVTMRNIDLGSSCIMCNNEMIGNCSKLPNQQQWMVSRNETGCFGSSTLEISVSITDFKQSDVGRLMLAWSSDASGQGPKDHEALTVTSLNFNRTEQNTGSKRDMSRFIYAGIGSGGVCVVIGVSVIAVVIGVVVHKKRKRNARRQRRRAQRRYEAHNGGGAGVRVQVAVTTTTEAEASDNEEQHLLGGGNGCLPPDYRTIPRNGCINNDTTGSEIDNENVVLSSETDENVQDV